MALESSETELARTAHRVGDARRAECAETLADAFVQGELSQQEFDARTELCFAAVTDVDLSRLTADLSRPTSAQLAGLTDGGVDERRGVSMPAIVGFEAILVVVAYMLGVDLESELRAWYAIAFEIWAVGNLTGFAGAALLRPRSTPRRVEKR